MEIQIYSVEEFKENLNELITRVENGEHIGITDGTNTAVMTPTDNDIVRIYTDHDEAP
jgi:antitoxin (DNA-binding transcriptional repressor) of toxin-antitoxin stability system